MEQPEPYPTSALDSKMNLLSWKEDTPNTKEDNYTLHHNCNSTATLKSSLTMVCAHPVIFKNHQRLSSDMLVVQPALEKK